MDFTGALILFGGLLSFLMAAGLMLRRNREPGRWTPIWLLLSVGTWQFLGGLYAWLAGNGLESVARASHHLAVVSYFWTGPFLYRYLQETLAQPTGRFWIHLAPGSLAAVAFIVHLALFGHRLSSDAYLFMPVPLTLAYASAVSMAIYGLICVVRVFALWKNPGSLPPEVVRSLGLVLLLTLFLSVIEVLSPGDALNVMVSFLLAALFLLGSRYPEFLSIIRDEAEGRRYIHSHLHGLSLESLESQLNDLMELEELFKDESLSMPDLAQRLDISHHQLSELLNTRFGKSFYSFLNGHRVRHAMQLLKERRDLSVSAVGYESGFNSNSSFYEAFRRVSGLSPGQFRKTE